MATRPPSKKNRFEHRDDVLKALGIFRTADAVAKGISQPTLSRMAKEGTIERLEHGIFMHRDFAKPEHVEFIVACLRTGPDSVIGGLTALFYYVLADQVPTQTWVMVPNSNRGTYPNYRILRTKHDPKVEVDDFGTWRIVTLERSIVEAFAYATKIGYLTALTAARTAIAEEKTTDTKLHMAAKNLGLWPLMTKHWEAITTK